MMNDPVVIQNLVKNGPKMLKNPRQYFAVYNPKVLDNSLQKDGGLLAAARPGHGAERRSGALRPLGGKRRRWQSRTGTSRSSPWLANSLRRAERPSARCRKLLPKLANAPAAGKWPGKLGLWSKG